MRFISYVFTLCHSPLLSTCLIILALVLGFKPIMACSYLLGTRIHYGDTLVMFGYLGFCLFWIYDLAILFNCWLTLIYDYFLCAFSFNCLMNLSRPSNDGIIKSTSSNLFVLSCNYLTLGIGK